MLLPATVDLYFIWLKYTYSYKEVCGCCFESNQDFSFSLQVSPWLAFYHFNRGITWVYTSLMMYYFYQRKAEYWLIRRYLHIYSLFATCLFVFLITSTLCLDRWCLLLRPGLSYSSHPRVVSCWDISRHNKGEQIVQFYYSWFNVYNLEVILTSLLRS